MDDGDEIMEFKRDKVEVEDTPEKKDLMMKIVLFLVAILIVSLMALWYTGFLSFMNEPVNGLLRNYDDSCETADDCTLAVITCGNSQCPQPINSESYKKPICLFRTMLDFSKDCGSEKVDCIENKCSTI